MTWHIPLPFCHPFFGKVFLWRVKMKKETTPHKITAVELKRLLVTLHGYSPCVFFRCRQVGAMWMKRHAQISSITGNSVILYNEKESKYTFVDINNIVQFDLDERFQHYQPHCHYEVEPSSELVNGA